MHLPSLVFTYLITYLFKYSKRIALEINLGKNALEDLFKDEKGRKTQEIVPMDIKEQFPLSMAMEEQKAKNDKEIRISRK